MLESIRKEYRQSLKSTDTEEHIDLAFYRPVGFAWALLFRKLHVTPNAVTIASVFIGVGAGICFYPTQLSVNILGMLLLILANSFDSADGQLARLTGQYSRIGRILDGMAGDLWFISIYVAICLRSNLTVPFFSAHPWIIWVVASLAGICHARQAAMADRLRQFHLCFVKKSFPSELEDSASILRRFRSLSWRKCPEKIVLWFYYTYTRTQEQSTPAMQILLYKLRGDGSSNTIDTDSAENIRIATLPLCKWENFLTFNWRSITLFITLFAGVPYWYFIIELTVFNGVMVYMLRRHERICREFALWRS